MLMAEVGAPPTRPDADAISGALVLCKVTKFDVQTVARVTAVPFACRQEGSCLFWRLRLHTPLLNASDMHGCVESFEYRFFRSFGHLTLTNHQ